MSARVHLAHHLSEDAIFAHSRAAQRPIARAHWQVLWTVARDWRTDDIAEAVDYSPT